MEDVSSILYMQVFKQKPKEVRYMSKWEKSLIGREKSNAKAV